MGDPGLGGGFGAGKRWHRVGSTPRAASTEAPHSLQRPRLRFALSVLPKVTAGTVWKELFPLLGRGLVPAEPWSPVTSTGSTSTALFCWQ